MQIDGSLPLKLIDKTSWTSYARVAAFWILFLLSVSPLLSMLTFVISCKNEPLHMLALLDAYHLHLAMNMGLGMLAAIVFAAWTIIQCCTLGFSGALKALLDQKWALLLLLFLFWVLFCTLVNCSNLEAAFLGDEYRLEGILSLLCYLGFTLCAMIVNDSRRRKMLLLAFCVTSVVIGLLYIAQIAGIGMLAELNNYGFCVIFGNINHHAYYVAMGLLAAAGLFVYEKRIALSVASAATVVLLTVCLIINGSFGPFLASAFALVFLAVIALIRDGKGKLVALVPLALFLVVSLVNVAGINYKAALSSIAQSTPAQEQAVEPEGEPESSAGASSTTGSNFSTLIQDIKMVLSGDADAGHAGSGRMALYIASGQLIAESPLLGYGMEQGGPLLDERAGIGIDRAHSEILQWGIYGGIPAMLLYVAGLAMLAVHQLRRLRQLDPLTVISIACCAEYLVSSLFGVAMITTAPYFWMFIGFAASLPASNEQEMELAPTDELAIQQ